jgi:hypothetical protein
MDGWSSEWSYFVDYDADIMAALNRLREDVFSRGDYVTGDSVFYSGGRMFIPPSPPKPKPATIEELLG